MSTVLDLGPELARKRLVAEMERVDLGDWDTTPDCLDGLAILIGNRAAGGQEVGELPALLRALARAEGVDLHPRASAALP